MGLGGIFKDIGKALGTAGKGAWKGIRVVDDAVESVPFGEELVAAIPVAGPALSMALKRVDAVEEMSGPGRGTTKREEAERLVIQDLMAVGLSPKYAHELVGLAFLMRQGEAGILEEES